MLALSAIAVVAVPAYAGGPISFYGVISDRGNHPLTSGNITITVTDVIGNTVNNVSGTIGSNGWYVLTISDYVSTCGYVRFTVSYGGNTYEKSSPDRDCYRGGQTYNIDLQYADINTVTPTPTPEPLAVEPSHSPETNGTLAPAGLQQTGSPTPLQPESSGGNLTLATPGNSSSEDPVNQTTQSMTTAPGNASGTLVVPVSNGTPADGSQNASESQGAVMATPFPGALVTLLAVISSFALLCRLKK